MPTSPKVCACSTLGNLKCQIEPYGSYCLSEVTSVTSHRLYYSVYAQNVRLQHERKHVDADATRQQRIQ